MLRELESFIGQCAAPAVLETGDDSLPLAPGEYELSIRRDALFLAAWSETRSLNRQIVAVEGRKPGIVSCTIRLFGGATGTLDVVDLEHPKAAGRLLTGGRRRFGEMFRKMLHRQFPGWTIELLSTGMNLEQSFSPRYPRALLRLGNQNAAAMACPASADEPMFLSFALLWHDHVAGERRHREQVPLLLFVPESAGAVTALRLPWLRVRARLFRFNENGSAGEIDPADAGNIDTYVAVPSVAGLPPEAREFLAGLSEAYGVEAAEEADASVRLRIDGLAFARWRDGRYYCGLHADEEHPAAGTSEVEQFASQLAGLRRAAGQSSLLSRMAPERRLEAAVRKQAGLIDPELEGRPLRSQVITFAGASRDVIDLLGIAASGRATILELKASEDIHLPIQALDYWLRIRWHLERGELAAAFPGQTLAAAAPKLILVAPAMQFHSANECVLSYFREQVETERVGLNLEWQQGLKVAFRLHGAEQPLSHGRSL